MSVDKYPSMFRAKCGRLLFIYKCQDFVNLEKKSEMNTCHAYQTKSFHLSILVTFSNSFKTTGDHTATILFGSPPGLHVYNIAIVVKNKKK